MGEPIHAAVTSLERTSRTGLANDTYDEWADGQNVAVAALARARVRYNNAVKCLQLSVDGGPYNCLSAGTVPGAAFYLSAAVPTPIAAANTPYKVLGTTTAKSLRDFTHTNNRLTYSGTATRTFLVCAMQSFVGVTNGQVARFYVAKNGTVIADSRQDDELTLATGIRANGVQTLVDLATGEYIELWVEGSIGGVAETITVSKLFFEAAALFGGAGQANALPIDFTTGDRILAGLTNNSAAFETKRRFRYQGKNYLGLHGWFRIVAQRNTGGGSGEVQIWDETNGVQVAFITGINAAAPTLYSVALVAGNIPANGAIFRLDMRRTAAANWELYSYHFE